MRDSTAFEKLAEKIFSRLKNDHHYESVEHNVQMEGKDGQRQIDIVLKGRVGPIDIITIVECKDHNKNLDVTFIDALHSKTQDVNAHKAVLVARKGFTKNAVRKAKRLGISLCTAHQAFSKKWEIRVELPVVIEEMFPVKVTPHYEVTFEKKETIVLGFSINDVDILSRFSECWNRGEVIFKNDSEIHDWRPKEIVEPYFIRNTEGEKIGIERFSLKFRIGRAFYFGYMNELESSKVIDFITEEKMTVVFEPSELMEYRNKFERIQRPDEIPILNAHTLRCFSVPKIEVNPGVMTVTRKDKHL